MLIIRIRTRGKIKTQHFHTQKKYSGDSCKGLDKLLRGTLFIFDLLQGWLTEGETGIPIFYDSQIKEALDSPWKRGGVVHVARREKGAALSGWSGKGGSLVGVRPTSRHVTLCLFPPP